MITGFNTDVRHNDKVYHVQTEDKGRQNPKIESLVYVGGEILDSCRTQYDEDKSQLSEEGIMALLEGQHKRVIRAIKLGRYDEAKPLEYEGFSGRDLDELALAYLAENMAEESLKLVVNGVADLLRGQPSTLQVQTSVQPSGEPASRASVRVKVAAPKLKTTVLGVGETDGEGRLALRVSPPAKDGEFALVIQAYSDVGAAEQRFPSRH